MTTSTMRLFRPADTPSAGRELHGPVLGIVESVPEIRHLRAFVAVAEELNFTRAAERLHLAQPALSATIRQLEDELGVELFRRTTRRVHITAAGEQMLPHARAALESTASAVAAAQDAGRGLVGRLRLGVSPVARRPVVLDLQQAWARERPGIAVHTTEGHTAGLVELLDTGHLDLVIGWCPIHVPGLRFERLKDERLVAHISSEHSLAAEQSVTLDRLAREPILVGSGPGSAGYTAGIIATFERAGLHPQTIHDPYPDTGLLAAIEGRSVTVGPIQQFDDVSAELAVLQIEPPCTLPFELAWREADGSAPLGAILSVSRRVRDANAWLQAQTAPKPADRPP